MAEDGDDMADLAYLVDADERLSRPELDLAAAAAAAATHQDDAKSVDMRVSMPESLVIPRDLSMYGPPPPVPRKDTRPNTRIYTADEIRAMQKAELAATVQRQQENKKKDDEHETPVAARREIPSVAESWDIKIAMPAAVVPAQHATDLRSMPAKAQPSTVTMQAFNPLLMSPPSPAPDAAPRPRSETPSRPARPTSLRLPSEPPPEDKILNKVFKVERPFITVEPRPYTADSRSTRAQTVYTSTTIKTAASSRVVKYGRGKNATTELIPQPTDEPNDPLNWQPWRKELNFYALLTTVALCNVMKTALFSVNFVLSQQFGRSYVAVAALTGVPLILSAVTGLASSIAHKLWGRRPVYLISSVSLFIGLVWASRARDSYGQLMGARIFQGFGWGAFDVLVAGSISDTFFEHERYSKQAVYQIINIATTWGPAFVSGFVSQSTASGFALQFEILAIFQAVSIPLLVLGAPETMFHRNSQASYDQPLNTTTPPPLPAWTPFTNASQRLLPPWTNRYGLLLHRTAQYLDAVIVPPPTTQPTTPTITRHILQQAPRALIAPTTLLAFLVAFLPSALLWGYASSLAALFPTLLTPASTGSLLATPFILATASAAIIFSSPLTKRTCSCASSSTTSSHHTSSSSPQRTLIVVLTTGTTLSFIGALAFALYTTSSGSDIRFPALSFLLGLLAAGAYVLDAAAAAPQLAASARFTAPNWAASLRVERDLGAGLAVWRALFAGVFVLGVSAAAGSIRGVGIGGSVGLVVAAGMVGAGWVFKGEAVRRLDGRVLRCVDLEEVRRMRSVFEVDD